MSRTISFYGNSDDLAEVVGDVPGCDEYGCYDEVARFRVEADGERLDVWLHYTGTWHASVALSDEEVPLPDWPIRVDRAERKSGWHPDASLIPHPYSTRVSIDVPENATVTRLTEQGKPWEATDD